MLGRRESAPDTRVTSLLGYFYSIKVDNDHFLVFVDIVAESQQRAPLPLDLNSNQLGPSFKLLKLLFSVEYRRQ